MRLTDEFIQIKRRLWCRWITEISSPADVHVIVNSYQSKLPFQVWISDETRRLSYAMLEKTASCLQEGRKSSKWAK